MKADLIDRKMLKTLAGVFTLLLFSLLTVAQPTRSTDEKDDKDEKPDLSEKDFSDRLVYGGNIGLSFGNTTSIRISPKIGYRLNRRWIAGIGGTYNYISVNIPRLGKFQDNIYGGMLFTNYRVFNNFLAIGRVELMNVRNRTNNRFSDEIRVWQPGNMLGVGYRQGTGGKVVFDMQILHNFSYRPGVSPYSSPWVMQFNIFIL